MKSYYDYDVNFEHVYFNKLNEQDQQFLLIIAAIEQNDKDRDSKIQLVSKLFDRNYVILNLTGSYRANIFNEDTIRLSRDIRGCSLADINKFFDNHLLDMVNKTKGTANNSDPFKYKFFETVGYNTLGKKFLRYFFARVDSFIGEQSGLPHGTYKQLVEQYKGTDVHHIEHILADNTHNLGLFQDEDDFNEWRNRLGGLLLLKGRDNQSSGNELYVDKLKTYTASGTLWAKTLLPNFYHANIGFKNFRAKYNLGFVSYNHFDRQSIEERQKLLYDLVKLIWEI